MGIAVRLAVTLLTLVSAFLFVHWMGASLLFAAGAPPSLGAVAALLASAAAAAFVWRGTARAGEGLTRSVGVGALVIGALGFAGGFFGPMLLAPGANQGPMLGLFVTGPLGLVVGALAGAAAWMARGRGRTP